MKRTILLALFLWAAAAGGHTLPISYLLLVPDTDYLHLELTLNPFELNCLGGPEQDKEIRLSGNQPGSKPSGLAQQILNCLDLRVGEKRVLAEIAGIGADPDSHHLTLRAHYRVDARSAAISVESKLTSVMGVSHLTQVTCLRAGHEQLAQLNGPAATVVFAALERKSGASEQKQTAPEAPASPGLRAVPGSQQPPTQGSAQIISPLLVQSAGLRAQDGSWSGGFGSSSNRHSAGRGTVFVAGFVLALPCAGIAAAMLLTVFLHRKKPGAHDPSSVPRRVPQQPISYAHSSSAANSTSKNYV